MPQLAQDIISHIVDARQGKCSFQFKLIIGKFKQHVQDNVANDLKQDASPWEALGEAMSHVIEQSNALFPAVLEQENTIRGMLLQLLSERQLTSFIFSFWYRSLD